MLLPIILPSHSYQKTSVLSSVRAFSLQGRVPQNVFTVWGTNEGGMLDCHAQLHLGDVGSQFPDSAESSSKPYTLRLQFNVSSQSSVAWDHPIA